MPIPYKIDIEGLIKSNIITVEKDCSGFFIDKSVTISFSPQLYSDLSFRYQIPKDDIYRFIGKCIYEADKGMWDQ
jgi:hypothetical protein